MNRRSAQPTSAFVAAIFTAMTVTAVARAAPPTPDDRRPHTFTAADRQFRIDGQPIELVAGEMHPQRVPFHFWEDRIKKARAMGLNTLSAYLFWNQCEPAEGQFDFTGDNDIRRFVQLCQQNGLWVVLRPGPYACAETEFGGYPAWLLKHHDLKLRSDQPQFMEYNRRYLNAVGKQLHDLLVTHGGPVVMVQVENELGRIDPYLADLKQAFVDAGFDGQLFTCDHSGNVWDHKDGLPGVLRATNGLPNQTKLDQALAVAGNFPVYGSEVYTSWFSVWGGPVGGPAGKHKPVDRQLRDTQWILDRHLSFCLYVYDGGTNFGFSNGANGWQPVQTTYDYEAPIDELGRVTPKYHALRQQFAAALGSTPPTVPADPPVISIPPFPLTLTGPLTASLPTSPTAHVDDVVTMEDLGQNYGFILYRKTFDHGVTGRLDLRKALDYSIVITNGHVVGRAFAGYGPGSFVVPLNSTGPTTLDVLVYNLGRNSVGISQTGNRKGLTENPTLDGQPVRGWDVFSLPMDTPPTIVPKSEATDGPALYNGTFRLDHVGETYLDLHDWHMGVVYVNGHNLGRYWDVGADRGLYLPSVWQRVGDNQVTVLELAGPPTAATLSGGTTRPESPAIPFPALTRRLSAAATTQE
jgi:beta-galactosidase